MFLSSLCLRFAHRIFWLDFIFRAVVFVVDCNSVPKHKCSTPTYSDKRQTDDDSLKPDHFRQLGKVQDMSECIAKCCDVEHCDLAMMSYGGQNCYGVACFSENLCQMLPSYPTRISFDVAHVSRWSMGEDRESRFIHLTVYFKDCMVFRQTFQANSKNSRLFVPELQIYEA